MGLAGPKNKQRIGLDPQNKNWKDDKSKFGFKMLQKMGWSEGKGLGANMDGQSEHVKVRLKQDNLGVGADRRSVDNWLDNNSAFDDLLKGLNNVGENGLKEVVNETESRKEPTQPAHGRLYHRQKFLRNKAVSNYDTSDLNMILGVKSTDTVTETEETTTLTATITEESTTTVAEDSLLKKAATNVHDYFAQKMAAMGLASSRVKNGDGDEDEERPSFGGLGLGATQIRNGKGTGLGFSSFVKSTVEVSLTETLTQNTSLNGQDVGHQIPLKSGEEEQGETNEINEVKEGKVKKGKKNKKRKRADGEENGKLAVDESVKSKKRKSLGEVHDNSTKIEKGDEKKEKKKDRKEKTKKEKKSKKADATDSTDSSPPVNGTAEPNTEKKAKKDKKRKRNTAESPDTTSTPPSHLNGDAIGTADKKSKKEKKRKRDADQQTEGTVPLETNGNQKKEKKTKKSRKDVNETSITEDSSSETLKTKKRKEKVDETNGIKESKKDKKKKKKGRD